jgi:hypothetical protein
MLLRAADFLLADHSLFNIDIEADGRAFYDSQRCQKPPPERLSSDSRHY